jgi:hypothetical protein
MESTETQQQFTEMNIAKNHSCILEHTMENIVAARNHRILWLLAPYLKLLHLKGFGIWESAAPRGERSGQAYRT